MIICHSISVQGNTSELPHLNNIQNVITTHEIQNGAKSHSSVPFNTTKVK